MREWLVITAVGVGIFFVVVGLCGIVEWIVGAYKDKARLDWLDSNPDVYYLYGADGVEFAEGDNLREAIDNAMKGNIWPPPQV